MAFPVQKTQYFHLRALQHLNHKKKGYNAEYCFSDSELLRMMGYYPNTRNRLMIETALALLKDINMIDYSPSYQREGHNGQYHDLYWVGKRYHPVEVAAQELAKELLTEGNVEEGLKLTYILSEHGYSQFDSSPLTEVEEKELSKRNISESNPGMARKKLRLAMAEENNEEKVLQDLRF